MTNRKGKATAIRILIADDHAVVRRGLRQIVEKTRDIVVATEVADGRAVLQALREEPNFDVIVLDIAMPGMDGIQVLTALKAAAVSIPVLCLSMYSEDHYALRVLRGGAAGFLNKESAPEELIEAIREVAKGRRYITRDMASRILELTDGRRAGPPHASLSNRELQILRMLGSSKSVSEISMELKISVKTVSTYRGRILTKMKMKNNAELMRYVMETHLL